MMLIPDRISENKATSPHNMWFPIASTWIHASFHSGHIYWLLSDSI